MKDSTKATTLEGQGLAASLPKENKGFFYLAVGVALFAGLLLLGTGYIISAQNAKKPKGVDAGASASSASYKTGDSSKVRVKKVTPVMHENAAFTTDGVTDPTKVRVVQADNSQDIDPAVAKKASENISTAAGKVTDAQVIGEYEKDAQSNLESLGYLVFPATVAKENPVPSGETRPAAGTVTGYLTYAGRTVGEQYAFINVVSQTASKQNGKVPLMRGMTLDAAKAALAAQGLKAFVIGESKSPSPLGTVVFQGTKEGVLMPAGCAVTLVVAQ